MTVPPQGSPHHELRRRIAGCRERLRRARTAQRQLDQAAPPAEQSGSAEPSAADEDADRRRERKPTRARR
ncbi:MAG: hypothetical protein LC785_09795 [Acidobacteria bacterium]|nr:hypothetical protein [Acidobacteriota bacterium]MCA1642223.1 hypothetical protein [Acidobacteriota bacterium]